MIDTIKQWDAHALVTGPRPASEINGAWHGFTLGGCARSIRHDTCRIREHAKRERDDAAV